MPVNSLHIDVTERCNFACRYCYKNDKDQESTMTFETAARAIGQLFNLAKGQPISLWFFGGEPLMVFDLVKDIVNFARGLDARCSVGATSNLSMLDDEKTEWMIKNNFKLHASIDGSPEWHDKVRITRGGGPTSDMVHSKIPLHRKIDPNDTVRPTIVPENILGLSDSIEYFFKAGYPGVAAVPAMGVDGWNKEALAALKVQTILTLRRFKEEWSRKNPMFNLWHVDHILRVTCATKSFRQETGCNYGCGAANNLISVDATGRFFPCHRTCGRAKTDHVLGDVIHGLSADALKAYQTRPLFCDKCGNGCQINCPALCDVTGKLDAGECKYNKILHEIKKEETELISWLDGYKEATRRINQMRQHQMKKMSCSKGENKEKDCKCNPSK